MYDQLRYFCVTGRSFNGTSPTIQPRENELHELYRKYFPQAQKKREEKPQPAPRSNDLFQWDGNIDHLPIRSETKELIRGGKPKGERSQAMMTVLNALVWSNLSDSQIFKIFEDYPIGEKWRSEKKSRENWLQKQVDKARAEITDRAKAAPDKRWEDRQQSSRGNLKSIVEEEWEEPTDLTRSIPPAPPFPGECLPYRILNWASDIAERMQTSLDMLAIAMIIVCAGLIGKDVYLRPKSRDNWKERPCLWGMLISPPASMKSQALSEGTAPLRRIQASMVEGDAERLKEWKTLKSEVNSRLKAHKRICDVLLKEDPNAALPPYPMQWQHCQTRRTHAVC